MRVDARGRKIEPQKPWELHRALAEWNILTGHIMPLLTCHAHDDPEVGSFAVERYFCARCVVCAGPALRGFCAREPGSTCYTMVLMARRLASAFARVARRQLSNSPSMWASNSLRCVWRAWGCVMVTQSAACRCCTRACLSCS